MNPRHFGPTENPVAAGLVAAILDRQWRGSSRVPRVPCRCPQDRGWPSGNVWRHRRMRRWPRGQRIPWECCWKLRQVARAGMMRMMGMVEDIFPSKSLEKLQKGGFLNNGEESFPQKWPYNLWAIRSVSKFRSGLFFGLDAAFHVSQWISGDSPCWNQEAARRRNKFLPMQKRCCSRGRVVLQQSLWLNG